MIHQLAGKVTWYDAQRKRYRCRLFYRATHLNRFVLRLSRLTNLYHVHGYEKAGL